MNNEQYKAWLKKLPELTAAQLADLSTRIKLLSNTAPKEHKGKQDFGDRLLQALCDTMRKNNVETPSVTVLRKSAAYVNSKGKIEDLAAYFEGVSKSKLVQDQILKQAIELLYFDLVNWQGIAISSHTLIKQIHRIPATLNKAFPGYAQSGLLTKIVKGS